MLKRIEGQPFVAPPKEIKNAWSDKRMIVATLIGGLLGAAAVYTSTRGGGASSIIAVVVVVLGAALIVVSFRNWKIGLQALLVIIVVEGAVRKWFLPSATELVYFYKDALMLIILIGYRRQHHKSPFLVKRSVQIFSLALVLFVTYAVASMIIPGGPDV